MELDSRNHILLSSEPAWKEFQEAVLDFTDAHRTPDPTAESGPLTPLFYRVVRHPLYLGFILAFWAGPVMTVGHLLFAATMTAYILFAIGLEERDLVHHLGDRYARYQRQVPMLAPPDREGPL